MTSTCSPTVRWRQSRHRSTARIVHFDSDKGAAGVSHAVTERGRVPLAGFLTEHDIIVNCVLQDTDAPLMFMTDEDLADMRPGTLVVDVSCDEGMAFGLGGPDLHPPHLRGR